MFAELHAHAVVAFGGELDHAGRDLAQGGAVALVDDELDLFLPVVLVVVVALEADDVGLERFARFLEARAELVGLLLRLLAALFGALLRVGGRVVDEERRVARGEYLDRLLRALGPRVGNGLGRSRGPRYDWLCRARVRRRSAWTIVLRARS